jgi:antitoxin component of MazEF toxin-antitoxin module
VIFYHFECSYYMEFNKPIKVLKGAESLLLILPKELGNKLDIENQEMLKVIVRNKELVIKKISDGERTQTTNNMEETCFAIT